MKSNNGKSSLSRCRSSFFSCCSLAESLPILIKLQCFGKQMDPEINIGPGIAASKSFRYGEEYFNSIRWHNRFMIACYLTLIGGFHPTRTVRFPFYQSRAIRDGDGNKATTRIWSESSSASQHSDERRGEKFSAFPVCLPSLIYLNFILSSFKKVFGFPSDFVVWAESLTREVFRLRIQVKNLKWKYEKKLSWQLVESKGILSSFSLAKRFRRDDLGQE